MPPSYRIVPSDPDADNVTELARQFSEQPGVKEVATATEAIRQIEGFFYKSESGSTGSGNSSGSRFSCT